MSRYVAIYLVLVLFIAARLRAAINPRAVVPFAMLSLLGLVPLRIATCLEENAIQFEK